MRTGIFQRLLNFYVFSNLHIALCAVLSCIATSFVLGLTMNPDVLMVVGGGTLSLYCWQRWLGVKQRENPDYPAVRHQWNYSNKNLLLAFTILGGLISLSGIYFLSIVTIKIVALAGAIGVLYSAPMIPMKGKLIRLRDLTGVKVFAIGLTWTIVCVWVPFSVALAKSTSQGMWHLTADAFVWKWSLIYFLAALGLTIPFDVRDEDFDQGVLRSLPMIFGARTMTFVAGFCLLSSGLLYWYFESCISGITFPHGLWKGYALWSIASAIIVFRSAKRSEMYYSLLIDGLLILLPVFLLIG
jgi:hypothetical protein